MQNHKYDGCKDADWMKESQTEVSNQSGESNQGGGRLKPEHRTGAGEVVGNQSGESNQGIEPKVQSPRSNEATDGREEQGRLKPEHRAGHGALEFEAVEAWPERVDGAALLDELESLMRRYVVLPKYAAETLALWCLHTYAFRFREVSTYLGIESPEKRCGKTTLLSLLSELAYRAVASANISPSSVFRVIEELQPTLLIDEGDTFLHGNDEIRGILNAGYTRKTAYVVRVAGKQVKSGAEVKSSECRVKNRNESKDQRLTSKGDERLGLLTPALSSGGGGEREIPRNGNGSRLARFSCWCPKVIATIGRLPDTLSDRCIVIRMQRKVVGEECERLRLEGPPEAPELRRKCLRFAADHAAAIASARPDVPPGLNDRAADVWEPLLVLADLAGEVWPEKARRAAEGLSANAQESSPIGALLLDILICFVTSSSDRLFSRDLVARLNQFGNRPWLELRNGKPITEMWLSQQLRPYGIRPQNIWVGEVQAKGYVQEDFDEVFRRYVPRSEVEALTGGGVDG